MKLKCKLDQIIINEQEKLINTTYLFKPTLEAYQKQVIFKVSGANADVIMENLKLPDGIGDTMILEMTLKEEQTELLGKGENGKKSGRTAANASN